MQSDQDTVIVDLNLPEDKRVVITWQRNVAVDSSIRIGNLLGSYHEVGDEKNTKVKIKAPISGKVTFLEPSGQEVSPKRICIMSVCKHDVVIMSMCTFCGKKITNSLHDSYGFVDTVYNLSHTKAQEVYEGIEVKVLEAKKLFLVLDLDNTLIHAEILSRQDYKNGKMDLGFDLEAEGVQILQFQRERFILKLRPFLREFLAELSTKYQIHVYTKGTRDYAERILLEVDPEKKYVSTERLISRDDMKDNQYKSINKVVHDGTMALILDDRSDVWGEIPNLIYTQPYHFFERFEGKIIATRRADVFLYMIKDTLQVIHEIFYSFYTKGGKIKVSDIYRFLRQSLFSLENVAFHRKFRDEEELLKSREYRSLQKLGAREVKKDPTLDSTLIFSHYRPKPKGYLETPIPIVSLWYIYYCEIYCTHLNPQLFDLRQENAVIINLERGMMASLKEQDKRKALDEKNSLKDEIESYLKNVEANKGGLDLIKEIAIKKVEENLKNKKGNKDEKMGMRIMTDEERKEGDELEKITKKVKTESGSYEINAEEEVDRNSAEKQDENGGKIVSEEDGNKGNSGNMEDGYEPTDSNMELE